MYVCCPCRLDFLAIECRYICFQIFLGRHLTFRVLQKEKKSFLNQSIRHRISKRTHPETFLLCNDIKKIVRSGFCGKRVILSSFLFLCKTLFSKLNKEKSFLKSLIFHASKLQKKFLAKYSQSKYNFC